MKCYAQQYLSLYLLAQVGQLLFSRGIHHTRHLPRRSQEPICLMEVLQAEIVSCCLQMLLASIKEKKVTPQARIQVCSARDHPNAIPQSMLILALCL